MVGTNDKVWLFDLASDPLEETDLAAAQPERVEALMANLLRLDAEQLPPAWLPQLEIPLAIDKTLEEPLLEGDPYVLFTN